MKIGMNALFYQTPANGSAQYMIHLLNSLAQVDSNNEYVLLGPRELPPSVQTPFPYEVHPVPGFTARNENIEKVVWEQFTSPGAARKSGAHLLHVPYFAPPLLPRTPTVVTIHDVIPLRLPAYHPTGKIKAYFNLVSRAAHRASHIITVSHHARQEIIESLNIQPERITVIYHATSEDFRPDPDPEKLAAARARYGLGERYIFYLGGLDQRKNVPQLIRAFAHLFPQIGDPDLQLLISGNPDKLRGSLFPDPRPVAADLGMEGQILYRFVEDDDKPLIYKGASAFVFPSLYEGFGIPPLEALACGTPVVCSNRTSLPEVVGDAALTIDPENMQEFVEALKRVLTDQELAADLRARGVQQAARFSWRKAAEQTLAVYENVLISQKK